MLFQWWGVSSSMTRDNNLPYDPQRQLDNYNKHIVYDDDGNHDDDGDSFWAHHDYNQTIITSTVTIRVTPSNDYMVSWACLSALFLVAIGWAGWQVYMERNIDRPMSTAATVTVAVAGGATTGKSGGSGNGGGGDHGRDSDRLVDSSSTAEVTRCVFRRLLLFAMLSRFICIPVMIWSDPIWCQFVGDTLPEMIFATAWTLLVTFFVQVVGIATGTGTNTTPSIVIQLTAYIVYLGLILLELFNSVASVLLYALLCCIYAALLGTIAYFLPRLLSLLAPVHEPFLAWRLILCTVICTLLFSAHMIGFARIVVDPPQKVYWWWKYGCLEALPAILFLILLRPSAHHKDRASNSTVVAAPQHNTNEGSGGGWKRQHPQGALVRVDSIGSSHSNSPHHNHHQHGKQQQGGGGSLKGGSGHQQQQESTPLSKSPPQQQQQASYGAISNV